MKTRAWRLDAVIVGLLLGASAVAHAGPGGFTFTPPPGWINISRDAPQAERQKAPAALLEQAANPAIAFYAIEPDDGSDGFFDNMNAVVELGKRALLPTPAGLAEVEKGLQGEFAKQGMTYHSLKTGLVKVAGVTSGRVIGEVKAPNGPIILIQYVIPGDNAMAIVTFTTTPANLAHNEPIFEAAVQSIRGAVEPSTIASSTISGALIGGVAGAVGALIAVLLKRKKKAAPPVAPAPGSGPG